MDQHSGPIPAAFHSILTPGSTAPTPHLTLPQDEITRTLAQADRLLAADRWTDAANAYRIALGIRTDLADAWFNLGYALRRSGHFEDAMAAYGEALAHGVRQPEVAHLNRAAILSDHLRRDADAMVELQAALAAAPGFRPALLNLGNLHEERGDRGAAVDCYHRLLGPHRVTADAMRCIALARLLQLQPPASPDDALLTLAREAAADGSIPDRSALATLLFAIGRACDALGDTGAAFAAFSRGKAQAHAGARGYDPARARRRTQALIAASPAPAPGRPSASQAPTPQPVFICGMFRSGSTLLEQVLGGHPDVAIAGELDLLPRMASGVLAPFPATLATLDDVRCEALARDYHGNLLARLPAGSGHARYVTDKRPDNYLLIGLVKRLFPVARIVHTVRHPVDNALSIFMQHLNPRVFDYAGSLGDIGHQYGEYRRLMAHWKQIYPDDLFDFDYDAFVIDPEGTLRPLLEFLGLPWHAGCLAFHRLGNTVKTASYWQVREPLHAGASGRWRRYGEHLGPLLQALAAQGIAVDPD